MLPPVVLLRNVSSPVSLRCVLISTICFQTLEHAIMMSVEEVIGSQVFDEDAWKPCLDIITAGIQG